MRKMEFKYLMIKFLLFLVLLFSQATLAEVEQFYEPRIDGLRMDRCLTFAKGCNEPAANRWCFQEGYEKAIYWELLDNVGDKYPTKTISSKAICNNKSCDSFQFIVCYRP